MTWFGMPFGWHITHVDGFYLFVSLCPKAQALEYAAPVVTAPAPDGTTWHWPQSTG